jgi:hypothetical protein
MKSIPNKIISKVWTRFTHYIGDLITTKRMTYQEQFVACSIPKTIYFYEELTTDESWFDFEDKMVQSDNELLVYDVSKVFAVEKRFVIYNLDFVLKGYTVTYTPRNVANSHHFSISEESYTEYVDTVRLFSGIDFMNHSNIPSSMRNKITISFQGSLFGKPDREYYIYFCENLEYTVQVFKINPNMTRQKMLFGFWVSLEAGKHMQFSPPYFANEASISRSETQIR